MVQKLQLKKFLNEMHWQDRQDSIQNVMDIIDEMDKNPSRQEMLHVIGRIHDELWQYVSAKRKI